MNVKHIIAVARGVRYGAGCLCLLCGESPFNSAGTVRRIMGPNYAGWSTVSCPAATEVCEGCAALLSGRPGDDPAPLRTRSFAVIHGDLEILSREGLWRILRDPPRGIVSLSWAESQQKHHWLHAGVCTPMRLRIGSDHGTIDYVPADDRVLLEAVHRLLASPVGNAPILSRTFIRTGDYHPKAVAKYRSYDLDLWSLEAKVRQYRPSGLLDLVCWCAPCAPLDHDGGGSDMISSEDRVAAEILADVAASSQYRRDRGKEFWAGFFRHRMERCRRESLPQMVSRLMDWCQCSPQSGLARRIEEMDEDMQRDVECAVRERTALLVALAYDILRARRVG